MDSRNNLVTWDGSEPMKVRGRSAGDSSSKLGSDEHFAKSFLEATIFGMPNDDSSESMTANVENVGEPSGWKAVEFQWLCMYTIPHKITCTY